MRQSALKLLFSGMRGRVIWLDRYKRLEGPADISSSTLNQEETVHSKRW